MVDIAAKFQHHHLPTKAILVEVFTQADSLGRVGFTAYWWDEDFHTGPSWRGQVYKAPLSQYLRAWQSYTQVRVVSTEED